MHHYHLVPEVSPQKSAEYLAQKLAYYTDAADLAEDLQWQNPQIVVLDVRALPLYDLGHIPGAVSFPHRTMSGETLAVLDPQKLYITYCDGIGCNGSTKGALKLARAGFYVRELAGGLDFWQRDNLPVTRGLQPGQWPAADAGSECGC